MNKLTPSQLFYGIASWWAIPTSVGLDGPVDLRGCGEVCFDEGSSGEVMRKRDEMMASNSCLSKAKEDEMLFVLLARDEAAPATIRFWADERVRLGRNDAFDAQIEEALHCARVMEEERKP